VAIQFKRDYELLELEPTSNWELTRANYRRLVNIWHPDRFTDKPRERAHAQQQFIELTKSFNNLRSFYRENKRMPFERMTQSVSDLPEPPVSKRVNPKDHEIVQNSILNKRKPSKVSTRASPLRANWWIIPTVLTIVAGLFVFMYIDRSTRYKQIEEAKRVLRSTEPSAYMPNREAIAKHGNTNRMMNGADAKKVGEQLAKDVFK